MKIYEATEQAYKNGYEQGKKDALRRNIAREKLIDIITYYADFLPWETIDDMADSIMEKFATGNNVGDKWISVTEQEEPTENGTYLCHGYWFGSRRKQTETADFFGEWNIANNFILTHWMPLPEAPKGE